MHHEGTAGFVAQDASMKEASDIYIYIYSSCSQGLGFAGYSLLGKNASRFA